MEETVENPERRVTMARDKEWEARMQGMIYAYNIVKQGGMEALELDMKRRNVLRAPMKFTAKQMEEVYNAMAARVYNNMLTGMLYAIHDTFGFGKIRLVRLKQSFDKLVSNTMDLDYMGEHYVKLDDFAVELNEKYNIGIVVDLVAACQDAFDDDREEFRTCKVDRVIRELRENGFEDAAEFLDKKMA
jgi:hypothetical protein